MKNVTRQIEGLAALVGGTDSQVSALKAEKIQSL